MMRALPSFSKRVCRSIVLGLACLLSGCALANRDNRPVWNAFESKIVPESEAAFYATLPLTIPVGFVAILVDTFIAHPIQVVDDAWNDTYNMWTDLEFEEHYYTESAWLPLRAVATPVVFAGSLLGRSVFDLPTPGEVKKRRATAKERRRKAALTWLQRIAKGDDVRSSRSLRGVLDVDIVSAVKAALANGNAHGRILVYDAVGSCDDSTIVDWIAALGDASAVVRYRLIEEMPKSIEVPDDLLQRLYGDPDQAVAERARRRWQK